MRVNGKFDPLKYALPTNYVAPPTQVEKVSGGIPARTKKRQGKFAMVQLTTADRMRGLCPAWDIFLYLLHTHWDRRDKADKGVPVSNCITELAHIPKETKRRALVELERRGLIQVRRVPRKTPVAYVLVLSQN